MIDGFLALYLFMLAAFTGKEIIGRVPVILHTPLMSGSNFVHGIVLVGAMVALGEADTPLQQIDRLHRRVPRRGQRGRRLRRDRTHARDVQVEQEARRDRRERSDEIPIMLVSIADPGELFRRRGAAHPRHQAHVLAGHRAQRHPVGRRRRARRDARDVLPSARARPHIHRERGADLHRASRSARRRPGSAARRSR